MWYRITPRNSTTGTATNSSIGITDQIYTLFSLGSGLIARGKFGVASQEQALPLSVKIALGLFSYIGVWVATGHIALARGVALRCLQADPDSPDRPRMVGDLRKRLERLETKLNRYESSK